MLAFLHLLIFSKVFNLFSYISHIPSEKSKACANPGIFVRGVQVSLTKKALTFFFCFFLFVLSLFYSSKSNGQFQRNLSFFKVPEGANIIQGGGGGGGGGATFSRGVQLLIPYRNPYNL